MAFTTPRGRRGQKYIWTDLSISFRRALFVLSFCSSIASADLCRIHRCRGVV